MTATSLTIAVIRDAQGRLDDALQLLEGRATPEAYSARRILLRAKHRYLGATRVRHLGKGVIEPEPPRLHVHWVGDDNRVFAVEPWEGPIITAAATVAAERCFAERAPDGAAYLRLVNEEEHTVCVAPPPRGYAPD